MVSVKVPSSNPWNSRENDNDKTFFSCNSSLTTSILCPFVWHNPTSMAQAYIYASSKPRVLKSSNCVKWVTSSIQSTFFIIFFLHQSTFHVNPLDSSLAQLIVSLKTFLFIVKLGVQTMSRLTPEDFKVYWDSKTFSSLRSGPGDWLYNHSISPTTHQKTFLNRITLKSLHLWTH